MLVLQIYELICIYKRKRVKISGYLRGQIGNITYKRGLVCVCIMDMIAIAIKAKWSGVVIVLFD